MFNLPQKELEILKFWQEKDVFKKTLAKPAPKGPASTRDRSSTRGGDFVFY